MTTKTYSASDFQNTADAIARAGVDQSDEPVVLSALRIAARVMDGETIANVLQEPLVERELIAALTKDTTP